MTRYIQNTPEQKPTKESKPNPKFGGKKGDRDYSKLADAKRIISPNGGRR